MAFLQSAPDGYATFGGGSGEDVRNKAGAIDASKPGGGAIEFSVWDAPVGGNRITDLLDYEGDPTAGIVSPIADPQVIDEGMLLYYAPKAFPVTYLDRGIAGSLRIAIWQREIAAQLPTAIAKSDQAYDSLGAFSTQVDAIDARLTALPGSGFDLTRSRPSKIGRAGIPTGQVMQSSTFEPTSRTWFVASPTGSSPETLRVHRLSLAGVLLDTMTLTGAGHGYQISVELVAGVPYLWLTWTKAPTSGTGNTLVSFAYAAGTTKAIDDSGFTTYGNFQTAGDFVVLAHDWGAGYAAFRYGDGTTVTYTRRLIADVRSNNDVTYGQVGGIPSASRQYQGHATLGDHLYVLTGTSSTDRLISVYSWLTGGLTATVDVGALGLNADGTSPGPLEPEGLNTVTDPVTGLSSLIAGIAAGSAPRANLMYQFAMTGQDALAGDFSKGVASGDAGWHLVGGSGEPAFVNSWDNLGPTYAQASYRLLSSGMVVVTGVVTGGVRGTGIFILPVGYRPSLNINLPALVKCDVSVTGRLAISSNGQVTLPADGFNGSGAIGWASLDVTFWPES